MKKGIVILAAVSMWILSDLRVDSAENEYLSDDIVAYTDEIGEEYGICPEFIQAIIERESRGDKDANNGYCIGIMQIYQKYQEDRMERLGVSDLYDPYSNILVGADYLAELFDKYEDPYLVLMVYNMGYRKAISLYSNEQYTDYAVEICDRSVELERLHGK